MIPELALPRPLAHAEEDAAATAMRRAGARTAASAADIDLVLAVLFSEVMS
jgi:hypothetical protein